MIKSLLESPQPLFSLLYDGKPFIEIVNRFKIERYIDEDQTQGRILYADSQTGLQITQEYSLKPEFTAIEWVIILENKGTEATPLIENLLALDGIIPLKGSQPIHLYHAKGSKCEIDDFLPLSIALQADSPVELGTGKTGRSSQVTLPFMNLAGEENGYILAVGWTGSWKTIFEREENGIHIHAGMWETSLTLFPDERIRTPRILLAEWQGTHAQEGQNHLRRLLLTHYTRKVDGEIVLPPLAHMTMSTYHLTNSTDEDNELRALALAAELGLEAFWIDACWYGSGRQWWEDVGDWQIRRSSFPNGLKPISEVAHDKGMKFVLWFEPERVRFDTPIAREHPNFLLHCDQDPHNLLLDLGNPEAWTYIVEAVSRQILESGVDIYRQDFNFNPWPYWEKNDLPGRIGISEIHHIEGLYAFWDELLRRFPHLSIDNCASGGRRIDLETTLRSFPLWRSDFSDVSSMSLSQGLLQIGDQSQTAGLSQWVPLHSASIWTFTPYEFRSAMSTGLVVYCNMQDEHFPMEAAKLGFAELKRIRPYLLGDFYQLTPLTVVNTDWCAYQFHRRDLGEGIAVFLRRNSSPYSSFDVSLHAIEPDSTYLYGSSESFEAPVYAREIGLNLQRLNIQISEAQGSILLQYKKLNA